MIKKEKSENNYNLFYYMLYGESVSVLEKYKLSQLTEYDFLPFSKNTGVDYSFEISSFKVCKFHLSIWEIRN